MVSTLAYIRCSQVLYRYFSLVLALFHPGVSNVDMSRLLCSGPPSRYHSRAGQAVLVHCHCLTPFPVHVYLTHAWGPHSHEYALNILEQKMRCQTGAVTVCQDKPALHGYGSKREHSMILGERACKMTNGNVLWSTLPYNYSKYLAD